MQTILPAEFRHGMVLLLDGQPHRIEDFHTAGTAQSKHKLHTRLRNLKTGRHVERAFADSERVAAAELEQRAVQFSYAQGDRYVFLDAQTFDELTLTAEQIGARRDFLRENEEYRALLLEGELLDIELPDQIRMRVASTAAPQRAAQQSTLKPATLEGGLEIMVPLFIAPGDVIRVDTRTRKYLGKETA